MAMGKELGHVHERLAMVEMVADRTAALETRLESLAGEVAQVCIGGPSCFMTARKLIPATQY